MSEKLMPCDTRIETFPPLHDVNSCPFCGADREYIAAEEYEHGAGKRWRVFCLSCMATMDKGYCQTQWQALEAWNRRAQPENEPLTNAQRIRGMSDEELQKFLHEFESGDIDYAKTFCDLCCKDAALERRSVDCEGCLLWWLKNDAKQPQGLDYWTKQPAETEGKEWPT